MGPKPRTALLCLALLAAAACKPAPGPPPATAPSAAPSPAPPTDPPPEPVRPATGAGTWYPAETGALRATVTAFLDGARTRPPAERVVALVAPHAGYRFSGPVAGEAYAAVRGRAVDTVLLVGTSHRGPLDGISVVATGSYATPLGAVAVDAALARALLDNDETGRIRTQEEAHAGEHSLENQLPFLQVALAPGFAVVPVLIRARDPDDYAIFAASVEWAVEGGGKRVLLVASTDLSHFPPHEEAVKADKAVMEAAASLDPVRLLAVDRDILGRGVPGLECALCGLDAVVSVILAAKALGGGTGRVLDVRDSFETAGGSPERVVGYGAMLVLAARGEGLTMEAKGLLLSIAREAAEAALARRDPVFPAPSEIPDALTDPRGCFVTLRNPGHAVDSLRGCLGHYNLDAGVPLWKLVARQGALAATADSRFSHDPVTLAELKEKIEIEISVLSPFRRVEDPGEIVLGVHGVSLVWEGRRASVYLPQVATETGWDLETFLGRLCLKGGLPRDAWKDRARMRFDLFTAEVFGE